MERNETFKEWLLKVAFLPSLFLAFVLGMMLRDWQVKYDAEQMQESNVRDLPDVSTINTDNDYVLYQHEE